MERTQLTVSGRRWLVGLVVAFVAMSLALVAVAQPARANVGAPSWWTGDCDGAATGHYPGSYALGATFDGVKACGPGPTQGGTDHLVRFYSGAWGEYEWECVELVMRYMYLVYGIAPYSANGYQVVDNYTGSVLTKVPNNGASLPTSGDILSFAISTNHPGLGHTAVVTAEG